MTSQQAAALYPAVGLAGPRNGAEERTVAARADDGSSRGGAVADHVARAARRAVLTTSGVHRLRHSFCSHLAMRGAPARAIQELAGHQDLITTQRYRHLSPAAIEGAIRLLDCEGPAGHYVRSGARRGDILEIACVILYLQIVTVR